MLRDYTPGARLFAGFVDQHLIGSNRRGVWNCVNHRGIDGEFSSDAFLVHQFMCTWWVDFHIEEGLLEVFSWQP